MQWPVSAPFCQPLTGGTRVLLLTLSGDGPQIQRGMDRFADSLFLFLFPEPTYFDVDLDGLPKCQCQTSHIVRMILQCLLRTLPIL